MKKLITVIVVLAAGLYVGLSVSNKLEHLIAERNMQASVIGCETDYECQQLAGVEY